jgi:hypothetical protein
MTAPGAPQPAYVICQPIGQLSPQDRVCKVVDPLTGEIVLPPAGYVWVRGPDEVTIPSAFIK